ncbi:MAG: response regulator [Chloroflexota bacterium]|nr:response regulator [Chloroflexota bacterium]MDP9471526.1 response regulator [Chloroflexota bacterium]
MDHKTILVVDDERAILFMIAELLEDERYAVRPFVERRMALDSVDRKAPDLVTSEVMMPGIHGIAVAVALRERCIPVILMSAVARHRAVPGVPFIPKPFDLDRFLDAVSHALVA